MLFRSDHSLGLTVPVAATALGACVIEKHMTLSRADGGVDSDFSLEADEFAAMVSACHDAFAAIGQVNYDVKESEAGGRNYRRSLYVVNDIAKGGVLSTENVKSIRPGYGMLPKHYDDILGRRAKIALKKGDPLIWDMLEDE